MSEQPYFILGFWKIYWEIFWDELRIFLIRVATLLRQHKYLNAERKTLLSISLIKSQYIGYICISWYSRINQTQKKKLQAAYNRFILLLKLDII